MPPKENDRLTATQISHLEDWIRLGAPWPDEAAQQRHLEEERLKTRTDKGVLVSTSGGLADAWTYRRYRDEDLWGLSPR